jgi:UDP-glucose 4-epimerase
MRALVTGGAGFIGSHRVDRLVADGHRVAVVDDLSTGHRDRISGEVALHVIDVVNAREVTDVVIGYQPDVIYHLAGQILPTPETCPPATLAPYGISKYCAEQYVMLFNRLHAGRHVALRLGTVYGPRQDPHGEAGVVAIFCGHIARGTTPTVYGDGKQTRPPRRPTSSTGSQVSVSRRAFGAPTSS